MTYSVFLFPSMTDKLWTFPKLSSDSHGGWSANTCKANERQSQKNKWKRLAKSPKDDTKDKEKKHFIDTADAMLLLSIRTYMWVWLCMWRVILFNLKLVVWVINSHEKSWLSNLSLH